MSEKLLIRKDGLYVVEWDSSQRAWQPTHKPKADTILTQLRVSCDMETGVTLRDIFRIVDEYPLLKTFLKQYTWNEGLDQFHMNTRLPANETNITSLILEKYADEDSHVERVKHKGGTRERIIGVSYKVYEHFCGQGIDPEHLDWGEINYGLGAQQPCDIADIPIVMITKFLVEIPFIPGTENEQRKENPALFETEEDFSLLQILDVIYWELSFYGNPEDNEQP